MRGQTISRKGLSAGAALVLGALLAIAPAFACGAMSGSITATPTPVDAGAPVTVNGVQWMAAPDGKAVTLHWGGKSAPAAATLPAPEGGTFSHVLTAPAGAQGGNHQVTAVQEQLKEGQWVTQVASAIVEVRVPAPAPAPQATPAPAEPTPAPQPAPAVELATQPTAQPTPAAHPAVAPASRRTSIDMPAAQTAAPSPAVAPAPIEAVPPPPSGPGGRTDSEAADVVPAIPERPVNLGRPSPSSSDSTPVWLVAMVVLGVALAAGSSAAVVSDRRKRAARRAATVTTKSE